MRLKLLLLALSAATCAPAAAQTQQWITQFGFGPLTLDRARAITPSTDNGVFVAGETIDYGAPPPGTDEDAWIARYNSAGEQVWLRERATAGPDRANALTPDQTGGVFVAGRISPTFPQAWLARYDGAGTPLWERQFGPLEAVGLAPADAGGAFVAGWNGNQGWVARYDSAGTQVWYRVLVPHVAFAVAPDGSGGVFVAGYRSDFTNQAWLARYDGAGNQLWFLAPGSVPLGVARTAAPDGSGGVFIAGEISVAGGPYDAGLVRYTAAGVQAWSRQFGTAATEYVHALTPDGTGGAFVAGDTSGSLAGPFAGGNSDAWVARYNSAGQQTWLHQLGTSEMDEARALAGTGAGGFTVAGYTEGQLAGTGIADAWLARYGESCYPDCNADSQLTVADFGCFQTKFVAADPYADCNWDCQLTVADFGCFQTKFVQGCP